MKLIKYDKIKDVNGMSITAITQAVSNTVSNNMYGAPPNSSTTRSDREIWGQNDEGDDIDGSMTVNGNITIKAIAARSYDPDDDEDDGEEIEEEEGGGNLSVEGSIEAFEIDIKNAYARNHLYVNYPHPNGTKQCVVDLIRGCDNNISTNTTNIANNSINIQNNADEIEKLKKSVITEERIKELISQNTSSGNGSFNNPIILFSGRAYRFTSSTYSIYGCQVQKFSLSVEINGGLMTINITPNNGVKVHVYSINVMQWESDKTTDISDTDLQKRNAGAHWFEARPDNVYNTKKIYIREFHQADQNNDSWHSTTWFDYDSVNAVNVTLVGYITEE